MTLAFGTAALALALIAPISPAFADPQPNSISGTVTNADGPLGGIEVRAYAWSPTAPGSTVYSTHTGTDGTYVLDGIHDQYHIVFRDPSSAHATQWYPSAHHPMDSELVPTSETPTTGIDALLVPGGFVSGLVEDAGGPLAGATVRILYDWESQLLAATGTTALDGTFSIGGLGDASYRVEVISPTGYHRSAWFGGSDEWWFADNYAVTTGATTDLGTVVLPPAGIVSGIVREHTTNEPLAGIRVDLHNFVFGFERFAYTDETGAFEFGGLPASTYYVLYRDESNEYADRWYDGKPNLFVATAINLAAEQTFVADARLHEGSTVSGVVRDPDGLPLQNVQVEVTNGSVSKSDWTDEFGVYEVGGLAEGRYFIRVQDWSENYPYQWYDGQQSLLVATGIDVPAGGTVPGIDIDMLTGGTITGVVVGPGDIGLPGITVRANGEVIGWQRETTTQSDGSFTLGGLWTDAFKVGFEDPEGEYIAAWFDGAANPDLAEPVPVTVGENTNIGDVVLGPAGVVSGRVTDGEGNGVAEVTVHAANSPNWDHSATTDVDGYYTIGGLRPGDYRVGFTSNDFAEQWYNGTAGGAATYGAAQAVAVEAGGEYTIDAVLAPPVWGSLAGIVLDADGEPIEGVAVSAWRNPHSLVAQIETGGSGDYSLTDLQAGFDYFLRFDDPSNAHPTEWYTGASMWEQATAVHLPPADPHLALPTVQLRLPGGITGTIRDAATTEPLEGVPVTIWLRPDTYGVGGTIEGHWTVFTDSSGSYTFEGLAPGPYVVQAPGFPKDGADWELAEHYLSQYLQYYWPEEPRDSDESERVVVSAGLTKENIDFDLGTGAVLMGRITDAYSGRPIEGIYVSLTTQGGGLTLHGSGNSDSEGNYVVDLLWPADYYIALLDGSNLYRHMWSGNNIPGEFPIEVFSPEPNSVTVLDLVMFPAVHRGPVQVVTEPLDAAVSVNPWEKTEQVVSCPAGMSAVNGGVYVDLEPHEWTPDTVFIEQARWGDHGRPSSDAWILHVPVVPDEATSELVSQNQKAFVVCANMPVTIVESPIDPPLSPYPAAEGGVTLQCPDELRPINGGTFVDVEASEWTSDLLTIPHNSWRDHGSTSWGTWDLRVPAVPDVAHWLSVTANERAFVICGEVTILRPDLVTEIGNPTFEKVSNVFTCPGGAAALGGGWTTWSSYYDPPIAHAHVGDHGRPVLAGSIPSAWRLDVPKVLSRHQPPQGARAWVVCSLLPVSADVFVPSGGEYTLGVSEDADAPETELGWVVEITAPEESPEEPLVIKFILDQSLLPEGLELADLVVYRNGELVGECPGSEIADPDPCVTSRASVGSEFVLTVLSSQASDWTFGMALEDEEPDPDASVVRYAGSNRFGTAVEISKADFPNPAAVSLVFVAVGNNFPDALAGSAAAAALGAPLLLVDTNSVPDVTAAELTRLDPDTVVVLGGEAVISPGVATQLSAWGGVTRLAGSNRYATGAAISAFAFDDPSAVDEVIVATGANFPDALGGGPVGAAVGGPVLLVPPSGVLPAAVAAELTRLAPSRITVLGGESAVSSGMFTQLEAFAGTVVRKAGSNRYVTAIEASKHGFGSAVRVYVAVGTNFPDALAGAAAAGFYDAPVLLVPSNTLPPEVAAEITRLGATKVIILGGTGVVSLAVENALKALLGL